LPRYSFKSRLRYAFDNYMSRGTIALILGLFALSLAVILVVASFVLVFGELRGNPATEGLDFPELLWMSLLRTLDPGTMGSDVGSVPFVLSMLAVTLGGIFIISTLIGVISSGIEGKLADLRKGRSQVLETDHTVILGWSAQIFDILNEIVTANENKRNQRIVVLAERDKVEMEDDIRQRLRDTRTTRIVCRSGSPIELADLAIASLDTARAVIVLSPEVDYPDTDVIKTLLALSNEAIIPAGDRRPTIVAEIHDPSHVEIARLASRGEAQLLVGGELIGRIAAQTCRQPGLSIVYMELLDFAGDEIYFSTEPDLAGKTFGDALHEYRDSSLIGIAPAAGSPRINPPMDQPIGAQDRLIFISADDDTIQRTARPEGVLREDLIVIREHASLTPDATLVLGWNSRTPLVLVELDRYVAPGSKLTLIARGPGVAEQAADVKQRLTRLEMTYRDEESTDRAVLEAATEEGFDHVVVMAYADFYDAQRADARTLLTLLYLRDIEARLGDRFTIVSEMLDVRNRALAQVTRADDFIVSSRLVSLAMSQLAENPDLRAVLDDLFDEEGSEIYLKPAADYVVLDADVDFYTIVESARRRGEIAIGYRLLEAADDPARNFGVVLNPDKDALVRFGQRDRIVVIAED
jgi:voltage-gated potassium channel Kch